MILFFGALFGALLLFAAFHDVAKMTIPNWVSIALAVAFVPAAFLAGLPLNQIGIHIGVGLVAFIVGVGLFYARVWGGGDAKLFAASMLWIGLGATGQFIYGVALAGGLLALVIVIARRMKLKSDMDWLARLLNPKVGAPYAVAIAAGAFWAASSSPVLLPALVTAGVTS